MSTGVPSFIKNSMVGNFSDTTVQIEITNILVSGSIAKKNAPKIMLVKFSTTVASAFHTYTRTKNLEPSEIRLNPIPAFERSALEFRVNAAIMKIHSM